MVRHQKGCLSLRCSLMNKRPFKAILRFRFLPFHAVFNEVLICFRQLHGFTGLPSLDRECFSNFRAFPFTLLNSRDVVNVMSPF